MSETLYRQKSQKTGIVKDQKISKAIFVAFKQIRGWCPNFRTGLNGHFMTISSHFFTTHLYEWISFKKLKFRRSLWKPQKMEKLQKTQKKLFLTFSYLFSIPKNCPDLKFHCSFEVLHLEKLEKIFFQVWKKIVPLGKIFFLVGKIIFSIFPHEKTGKVRKIFCYHNCPDLSRFE